MATPRSATDTTGTEIWSWDSDAFGSTAANEDPDHNGIAFVQNLRFPGQYFDRESGLHYNYFRTYNPATGRYTQSDPIGLVGGLNTFSYVENAPEVGVDQFGLYLGSVHGDMTRAAAARVGLSSQTAIRLAERVIGMDTGTQRSYLAFMHAMCARGLTRDICQKNWQNYIQRNLKKCTDEGLAAAIHAAQDFYSGAHRDFAEYEGSVAERYPILARGFLRKLFEQIPVVPLSHPIHDRFPSDAEKAGVINVTTNVIEMYQDSCNCGK